MSSQDDFFIAVTFKVYTFFNIFFNEQKNF